ncbi:MAG TPA: GNAT family N-acetyltransferase [Oleiagrimonas sp.]|nr:GNAT family N-acetyltransferase [Oleiagrimonas sp.]
MNPFSFRAATAADIPALVALVQSAYRGDASRVGWTTEADLLDGQRIDADGVAADIARADSRVLLAERSGDLLACAHVEKQGDDGYFGMFAVRPALQGAGLGKAMLAEGERVVRDQWQCSRMRMSVIDVRDELIAWYERHGFRRTGTYRPFPYGDPRFGIPRRDDLRFEWLEKDIRPEVAA